MLLRQVFHIAEVKLDCRLHCILYELDLLVRTHLGLSVEVGRLDHIAVRIANGGAWGHANESVCRNLLTLQSELDVLCCAKVLEEARTEAWHRVQVVEAVLFVFAALVESWFRDVDVATSV